MPKWDGFHALCGITVLGKDEDRMQHRREFVALTWLTLAAFLGGAALGLVRPTALNALNPAALPGAIPAAPLETVPTPAETAPVAPAKPLPPPPAHPVTMVTMLA